MILARAEDDDSNSGFSEKFPNFQHHEGLFSGSGDDIPSRGIRRGNEGSPDSQQMSSLNMVSTANNRIYGTDAGNRRRFASTLSRIGDYIGQPSHKRFDYSEFQRGPAMNYPEIPGEGNRNRELSQLRNHWTPSIQERSSRDGSPGSRVDMIESISQPGRDSPQSPQSSKSIQLPTHHRTTRANTMPTRRSPMPLVDQHPSSSGDVRGRPRQHWATLEVPMRAHLAQTRINMSEFAADTIALPAGHRSPAIVVSAEPDSPTSGLHIS